MRAIAHQDGDTGLCVFGAALPYQIHYAHGFRAIVFVKKWMQRHRRAGRCFVPGKRTGKRPGKRPGKRIGITHCTAGYVFLLRHDAAEGVVHPRDDTGLRTKIHRKRERRQRNIAQAFVARLEKQADLGLAEAINGLHRIAHQEQCAPVALLPSGGEFFQ